MTRCGALRSRGVALLGAAMLLYVTSAAPTQDSDEEVSGGVAALSGGGASDLGSPWDGLDAPTLRQILLQIDADERAAYAPRELRSWSPLGARGWNGGNSGGPRGLDSRAVRQWRADKRQVRFRQCYFNPISCFRK